SVYECEPGEIIEFYIHLFDNTGDVAIIKRLFFRLTTGETSVESISDPYEELQPDGSDDILLSEELTIELGDIGTDNVWDAFNNDINEPFEINGDKFISAIQNGNDKLWQWRGGNGVFGASATPSIEANFLDLTEQTDLPTYNLFKKYN